MFVLKVRTVIVALIVTVMSFTTIMLTITADEALDADEVVTEWLAKSVCHSDYNKIYDPENPCVAADEEACDAKEEFTLTLDKVVVDCFYGTPGYRCGYKKSKKPEGKGSCEWKDNKCKEGDPPTKVKKEDCEDKQISGWAPHLEQ